MGLVGGVVLVEGLLNFDIKRLTSPFGEKGEGEVEDTLELIEDWRTLIRYCIFRETNPVFTPAIDLYSLPDMFGCRGVFDLVLDDVEVRLPVLLKKVDFNVEEELLLTNFESVFLVPIIAWVVVVIIAGKTNEVSVIVPFPNFIELSFLFLELIISNFSFQEM